MTKVWIGIKGRRKSVECCRSHRPSLTQDKLCVASAACSASTLTFRPISRAGNPPSPCHHPIPQVCNSMSAMKIKQTHHSQYHSRPIVTLDRGCGARVYQHLVCVHRPIVYWLRWVLQSQPRNSIKELIEEHQRWRLEKALILARVYWHFCVRVRSMSSELQRYKEIGSEDFVVNKHSKERHLISIAVHQSQ